MVTTAPGISLTLRIEHAWTEVILRGNIIGGAVSSNR